MTDLDRHFRESIASARNFAVIDVFVKITSKFLVHLEDVAHHSINDICKLLLRKPSRRRLYVDRNQNLLPSSENLRVRNLPVTSLFIQRSRSLANSICRLFVVPECRYDG